MNILLIGSGGREHALAWRLSQSPSCEKLFASPGNPGIAECAECVAISVTDHAAVVAFCKEQGVGFVVVGPEAPLASGIVDLFRSRGLGIFGPTQAAAQLESSKDFAKRFMARHRIPTAAFETFTDPALAHDYINQRGAPIVIKADGLAAGKGVVVAMTLDEAHAAIDDMLSGNKLGSAGARVVIEDFLDGEEASFIVLVDGKNVLPMATSQDHKRIGDGDTGPNTGGMGAYSPAPVVTPEVHAKVMREIIMPTVQGMAADGIPFTGFLYAGLMIGKDGSVKTLEFNARMGDPETQPIMMRLKSDAVKMFEHAIAGTLDQAETDWDRRVALGIVLAAQNYPETPRKGDTIHGLPTGNSAGEDAHVFHAGTADENGQVVTNGGRVLCVTALGENVKLAQKAAYEATAQITWDGLQYRRDIGYRAIGR